MPDSILIPPHEIKRIAAKINDHSRRVSQAVASVNDIVNQVNCGGFQGMRAELFRNNYQQRRTRIVGFAMVLTTFSQRLDDIADTFQGVDDRMAGDITGVLGGHHHGRQVSLDG